MIQRIDIRMHICPFCRIGISNCQSFQLHIPDNQFGWAVYTYYAGIANNRKCRRTSAIERYAWITAATKIIGINADVKAGTSIAQTKGTGSLNSTRTRCRITVKYKRYTDYKITGIRTERDYITVFSIRYGFVINKDNRTGKKFSNRRYTYANHDAILVTIFKKMIQVFLQVKLHRIPLFIHVNGFVVQRRDTGTAPVIAVIGKVVIIRTGYIAIIVEISIHAECTSFKDHIITYQAQTIEIHFVDDLKLYAVPGQEVIIKAISVQVIKSSGAIGICAELSEIKAITGKTRCDNRNSFSFNANYC